MKQSWLIFLLLSLVAVQAFPQNFGRNKIQYETIHWKKLQSRHFDVYYYAGGYHLAEFTADAAESSYVKLSRDINYALVDRISIIVYNSHADFEETNVSPEIVSSSVGGFTEFFKNRVIIPFEGSYEKFRHVLHHELTHAVSLQFFFGAGPGAILKGISRLNLPLWFVEGMAEYMSLRWNSDSDMFLRDASISGYLPEIPNLSAYMAYKGGQALYYYIAKTYGDKKISEMLWSVRNRRNVEQGIKEALRIDLKELSEQWRTAMRKQYWPDIKDRKSPKEFSQRLTDNRKWMNFVNNSPALSPNGDKLAFLSDKSGYFDIYLMSTQDAKIIKKLVSGQRKAELEDLNWLTPGMSWSGDGKSLVFSAKSGAEDALKIIDVEKNEISESLKLGLDAIYSPNWNPKKNQIVFSGLKDGATDIYIYDLDAKQLTQVTKDIFSDLSPVWSPDGTRIAFTSDRGEMIENLSADLKIQNFDYHQTDIYLVNPADRKIQPITRTTEYQEISPEFTSDGRLAYISDRNGIFNIFLYDFQTGTEKVLTNLLTGCAQLSWSKTGDRLAFTAFEGGGYNIYLWVNPLENVKEPDILENTVYLNDLAAGIRVGEMDYADTDSSEQKKLRNEMQARQSFRSFVFDEDFSEARINFSDQKSKTIQLAEADYKNENGDYKSKDYKTQFSVDWAGAYMGYDPFWGMQGLTQIIFSDLLGNHQIGLGINIIQSIQNSDFQLVYSHLPRRLDFQTSAYHFVNFFQTSLGLVRFRNYGAGLYTSYPINRFFRINTGLNSINVLEENLEYDFFTSRTIRSILPSVGVTADNTIWEFFGPSAGRRWDISLGVSPSFGESTLDFQTVTSDLRQYFALSREFSLALRFAGGISFGQQPQRFVLGGLSNWINHRFKDNIPYANIEDLFFSSYITPLRGSDFYEQYGSRYFLTNIEFKFPLIDYLLLRFPLPMGLSYIRGAAFLDAGSAWENDNTFRAFKKNDIGQTVTDDLIVGFGYGIRIYLGFALLRIDSAWRTDFQNYSAPIFYFSLGQDF